MPSHYTEEKRKEYWQRYAAKKPPEWTVWKSMKIRCHYAEHRWYDNYGGRGIVVCDRWREHGAGFKNFLEDMGPRPSSEYDLSRRDHDGPYCRENCIWEHISSNRSNNGGIDGFKNIEACGGRG